MSGNFRIRYTAPFLPVLVSPLSLNLTFLEVSPEMLIFLLTLPQLLLTMLSNVPFTRVVSLLSLAI